MRHFKKLFTMDNYTPPESAEIVQLYFQKSFSIVATQRAFRLKNKTAATATTPLKTHN